MAHNHRSTPLAIMAFCVMAPLVLLIPVLATLYIMWEIIRSAVEDCASRLEKLARWVKRDCRRVPPG